MVQKKKKNEMRTNSLLRAKLYFPLQQNHTAKRSRQRHVPARAARRRQLVTAMDGLEQPGLKHSFWLPRSFAWFPVLHTLCNHFRGSRCGPGAILNTWETEEKDTIFTPKNVTQDYNVKYQILCPK